MDDSISVVAWIMRLIHVGSALVVAGGLVFQRLVLAPTLADKLSADERAGLYAPLMKRWKLIIHPTIILFLVSGFYSYLAITRFDHEGQGLYHALLGVKVLLAIVFFGLAIVLTSTMDWSVKLRERDGLWWLLFATLAGIVAIAGALRVMPLSTMG